GIGHDHVGEPDTITTPNRSVCLIKSMILEVLVIHQGRSDMDRTTLTIDRLLVLPLLDIVHTARERHLMERKFDKLLFLLINELSDIFLLAINDHGKSGLNRFPAELGS